MTQSQKEFEAWFARQKDREYCSENVKSLLAECWHAAVSSELKELRQQIKNLTRDADNTGKALNRRVDIENHLLQCYQGVMPLPNQQDCKVLALRLGTPKEYWSDYLKSYEFFPSQVSGEIH